jgi:hypothetical protein
LPQIVITWRGWSKDILIFQTERAQILLIHQRGRGRTGNAFIQSRGIYLLGLSGLNDQT